MKNIPLVSVGIFTYNHKQFIGECIDSALAQDYDNVEMVKDTVISFMQKFFLQIKSHSAD